LYILLENIGICLFDLDYQKILVKSNEISGSDRFITSDQVTHLYKYYIQSKLDQIDFVKQSYNEVQIIRCIKVVINATSRSISIKKKYKNVILDYCLLRKDFYDGVVP
jgi:hypothetical protein